jgi:queuosine precursor transporter
MWMTSNLAWGVLFVLVNFALFLTCYRLFGRVGLFAWAGFATVIANIQVVKTIELELLGLGVVMTLGNTIYASLSMATDLMNERYGAGEARRAVWFGFFSLIASTIIMQMVLVFEPHESDFAQESLQTIFSLLPRIALGSLCAYFVSQFLDIRLFSRLKARFASRNQFWIRINGSTAVSQFVDSLVFCAIAFWGEFTSDVWLQILFTTYLMKFVISIASTPVLYLARSFTFKEEN